MRDDAVAPVVAVMLILAVIVTFLSIWNAVVIPSMKQSSEIEHLRNVESAFQHFSSDIEKAVSLRQNNLVFSEPVQLGGGEVMFDSLRSSGSLYVRNEQVPIYNITLYDKTNAVIGHMNGTLAKISYEPLNNYWQDQGYQWQYGYINVSKYGTRQTPLNYYNMTDITNDTADIDNSSLARFAQSFGTVQYFLNQTFVQNKTPTVDNMYKFSPLSGYCSGLNLYAVTITTSKDHPFVSSNGYGTLTLISSINRTPYYDVAAISFGSGDQDVFRTVALKNWNTSLSDLNTTYCKNNVIFDSVSSATGFARYGIDRTVSPINVTITVVEIRIGAY